MSSERAYQFFRLVERMRDKQKEYFRTRNEAVFNESKQLERDVDKEIQRVNNALGNRQPSLFGAEIAKSEGWHDCKDKRRHSAKRGMVLDACRTCMRWRNYCKLFHYIMEIWWGWRLFR